MTRTNEMDRMEELHSLSKNKALSYTSIFFSFLTARYITIIDLIEITKVSMTLICYTILFYILCFQGANIFTSSSIGKLYYHALKRDKDRIIGFHIPQWDRKVQVRLPLTPPLYCYLFCTNFLFTFSPLDLFRIN